MGSLRKSISRPSRCSAASKVTASLRSGFVGVAGFVGAERDIGGVSAGGDSRSFVTVAAKAPLVRTRQASEMRPMELMARILVDDCCSASRVPSDPQFKAITVIVPVSVGRRQANP